MKKIFLIIIILFCFKSNGQENYSYKFEKMAITDTIYKKAEVDSLKNNSTYIYRDFFFADRYFKYETQGTILCLLKKENEYWISYAVPYEYGPYPSTNLIGPSENKNYFLAAAGSTYVSHGGGQGNEGTIEKLIIIDTENNSSITLDSYRSDKYWVYEDNSEDLKDSGENSMDSKYIFENNQLKILNTCFNAEGKIECPNPGGVYEFQNDILKKIKNYDPNTKGFKTINYIGDIALGMTLEEMNSVLPYSGFIEKDNIYGNCADETTGFEVSNNNKILGFALTKEIKQGNAEKAKEEHSDEYIDSENLKIYKFIVLSSEFNFEKININTKVSEVMKFYPKANVRLDLLSEWEHIYIQELNIELVFKTDESNRIGVYKNETFVKLKNKKAKPDFIIVSD